MKHHVTKREVVYEGRVITVSKNETTHPEFQTKMSVDLVEHNGAVVILAKAPNGKYILVEQYRFAAEQKTLEFPAGMIDLGETPFAAAQRELAEETELQAQELKKFYILYPSPGFLKEQHHFFLAENTTPISGYEQDEDEHINLRYFTLDELEELVASHKIVDMKTVMGIMYLRLHVE